MGLCSGKGQTCNCAHTHARTDTCVRTLTIYRDTCLHPVRAGYAWVGQEALEREVQAMARVCELESENEKLKDEKSKAQAKQTPMS